MPPSHSQWVGSGTHAHIGIYTEDRGFTHGLIKRSDKSKSNGIKCNSFLTIMMSL